MYDLFFVSGNRPPTMVFMLAFDMLAIAYDTNGRFIGTFPPP